MRRFVAFLGLVCLVAAGSAPGDEDLHEMMTKEEVMEVFRTEPHAVPKYQVVPIQLPKEHKRAAGSATSLHIKALGRNFKLWLNPTEGVLAGEDTPVYFTRSPSYGRSKRASNIRIFRVRGAMANVGRMLEDVEKQATMMVKTLDNGKDSITGIVGSERLVVRPLPSRVNEHYTRRFRRSTDNQEEEPIMIRDEAHYHVVYELPEQDPESYYRAIPLSEGAIEKQLNRSRRQVTVPEIIYPQVLIFADYNTYKLHGKNLNSLLEYLLPFWNGVDLRYRSLEGPKVRFNIAGIIVGEDDQATPYLELESPNTMWINLSLRGLTSFLTEIEGSIPKSTYDIAIHMGPHRMCDSVDGTCKILGLAYMGAACGRQRTGIIMDKGAFDGVDTAVHEIGHLFGADHDGEGDSDSCYADDGYIMTPNSIRTKNVADWSPCSLASFDKYLKDLGNTDPSCLFNEPQVSNPLPRVMPGRLMTLDEQCQRMQGTGYCYPLGLKGDDICISLPCFVKGNPRGCTTEMAPVDGTICGNGKVCFHAKCVDQSLLV